MPEQQVGGKYRLERQLSGGGMGSIWVAQDIILQRRVALKFIAPAHAGSPGVREQFEREALAVAQLQHPNVVSIYDYGLDGDAPYIVMELLEGEDLEARLARQGQLLPAVLARWLHQIAKGLGAAHERGIVHRDLKPANLFLARVGAEEIVKVVDFGIAQLQTLNAPVPGEPQGLIGTPRYMSPEQLRGDSPLDPRVDVWALAVVLYRALTGQFPFSKDAYKELLSKGDLGDCLPVAQAAPGLGNHFDDFFAQAFHPEVAKRFQTPAELAVHFSARVEKLGTQKTTKILVVDDEADVELLMRQRFRRHLRNKLYEFIFAREGEAALEQLRRHPDVDIVLSDINMPRMDGLTLLARVGEQYPWVKVIIVSAYSDFTNIRVAMNRGAFDFLVKPIDLEDLETTLLKTTKHVTELRQWLRSAEENNLLRTFMHGGIVDRLLPALRGNTSSTGERGEGSVVFVDIEGFTAVLQAQPPERSFHRLNAYFEVIVPVLAAYGARVDKFLGDAVMAVFQGEGHLLRALNACFAVHQQLGAKTHQGEDPGLGEHGVCIGLDSGSFLTGSIGSRAHGRLDYTVLGEVVNTAARLAAVATRDQILITETIAQRVGSSFECVELVPVQLAGESSARPVYNVLKGKDEAVGSRDATVSVFSGGFASRSEPLPPSGEG